MSYSQTGELTPSPAAAAAAAKESSMVPEKILESVTETLSYTEEVRNGLLQLFAVTGEDPDLLEELPPLIRARVYLLLAKTVTTLLSVQMRCTGIDPDEHPISKEFDRLRLCGEKLGKFQDWDKAPLKPSTRINTRAAARVIGHSLPQLTAEQKEGLRDISKGNEDRMIKLSADKRVRKKRKQSLNGPQVKKAAEEFLQKAAKELLGGNSEGGVRGPLRNLGDQEMHDDE
ncbi:hypothetical protein LUZ60_008826 [Juncus effusus]|nr:hypothetical protein LUZ60_008826 [Juncus effusus]